MLTSAKNADMMVDVIIPNKSTNAPKKDGKLRKNNRNADVWPIWLLLFGYFYIYSLCISLYTSIDCASLYGLCISKWRHNSYHIHCYYIFHKICWYRNSYWQTVILWWRFVEFSKKNIFIIITTNSKHSAVFGAIYVDRVESHSVETHRYSVWVWWCWVRLVFWAPLMDHLPIAHG